MRMMFARCCLTLGVASGSAFFSIGSWGCFEFYSADVPSLRWDPSVRGNLHVDIPVQFRTWCPSGEGGQSYRIALSDTGVDASLPVNSEGEDNFPAVTLKGFLGGHTQWNQGQSRTDITPGKWSRQQIAAHNNTLVGHLRLDISRDKLMTLPPGKNDLSFWVVGENTSGTSRRRSMEVSIPVEIPRTVRLSGLEDMDLYVQDVSGGWLWKNARFCVFVSEGGEYRLSFDSQSQPGGRFILKSQSNVPLPYRLSFIDDTRTSWISATQSGELPVSFRGSPDIDCQGRPNAKLRVEISARDIQTSPADVYVDVLTLTVRAV